MARRERAQRDRRLEKPAIEVLTATGEREATIAATEQGAGAALQAMITDESLTVFEAVQGAPALSVIGKRPGFAIQPQAHHSRGETSWGLCVEAVHDAKDPSAVGWGLLASSRRRQTHFPAGSAGESVKLRWSTP
jgi:hypothetical protein